ncbi:MAG TPA: glycosyltransferase [Acidimicrobiales bacterium]|nr:glycosyltransferase [Acidimicrobiales bacterium]
MTDVRVVHVVASDQRRGAEVFAADLVRALADRGAHQEVVALRRGGGAKVEFAAPTTVLACPPAAARAAAWAVWGLRRSVARGRGVVVCAHGGEALRAAVLAGAGPIVYRRIGAAPPSITTGPRRLWHRWLMGRAALVLCVAEAVRDETLDVFGLPPPRVRTVPNGVDPDRMARPDRAACRAAVGVEADARVVLSLGSLSWEKDPMRALRITAASRSGHGGGVHLLVGDGPLADAVRAAAAGDATVRLLPARGDVGVVLGAADVLLLCSRPDGMEGMPAVVIEAGLCGVAVVADRIAGVAEVVVDGESGVLVAPGDDAAASAAVSSLLADDARRMAMGASAASRCTEQFAIGPVADDYLDAFAEAAAGS